MSLVLSFPARVPLFVYTCLFLGMSAFFGKRARTASVAPSRKSSAPRRVARVVRRPRQPVGRGPGELKFHDVDVDDAVIAAGAVIQNAGTVNIIPQGVTEVQRVGRKCTIASIVWHYSLSLPIISNSGSGPAGETVRVILYLDKQANTATAANTDILESADFQSFRNLANVGRFELLHDKTYSMNYQAGAGDGAANDYAGYKVNGSFYKKCSIPIEFNGAAGAITEITSNNLGVLLCCEEGTAGFESKLRLRFSD